MQSRAIFSGTHTCGTIVNPMRTKCDGSCVNAHSVDVSAADGRLGKMAHHRRSDLPSAVGLIHDQRSHFRHTGAERRELRAPDDRITRVRHDEAAGVLLEILDGPRQQVPDLEVLADQAMDGGHVCRTSGPKRDGSVHWAPPAAVAMALSSNPTASSISVDVMMNGGSSRTTVSAVRLMSNPRLAPPQPPALRDDRARDPR